VNYFLEKQRREKTVCTKYYIKYGIASISNKEKFTKRIKYELHKNNKRRKIINR